MNTFRIVWILATALSGLMAGFLFAFAVVVMPGLKNLSDREYLHSFQVIDRVIQNSQPLFMVMWLGSTFTLVAAAVMSLNQEESWLRVLAVSSALASVFGVQLPTMRINIPLNNQVQSLDLESLDESALRQAREAFETPWNRWNNRRTVIACAILIALLLGFEQ